MKRCHFNLLPETTLTIAPKPDSNSPSIATYAAMATKQVSLKAKPTRKRDFGGV
jgi:hypothetical protein